MDRVGLRHKAAVRPSTLSGGQHQRVAIARSAADPVVFMDYGSVVESGWPDQVFGAAETDRLRRFLSQVL